MEEKLRRLRIAGRQNLILCLDADQGCGDVEIPPGARIVRFQRRIDLNDVLEMIEGGGEGKVTATPPGRAATA